LLLSYFLLMKKEYIFSGLIGLICILVRQDSTIWLLFFAIYIFFDEKNLAFSKQFVYKYLQKTWLYFIGIGVVAFYAFINHGSVALGDVAEHPVSLHMGNIYLFLLVIWLLFLPMHVVNLKK